MTHYKALLFILLIALGGCSYTMLKPSPRPPAALGEQLDITYLSGVFSQVSREYNSKGQKSTHYRRLFISQSGKFKVEEEFEGYRNTFSGHYVIIDDFLLLRNSARNEYPELYLIKYLQEGFELERVSGEIEKSQLIENDILLNGAWLENPRRYSLE
ncbi:MAG: hypothetical protein SCALA702_25280 [Melioribacteraceae bacterium]|nr:MAG: hypothetical protein SCALA702_25280 [Melioribacteraceae bacterium]